MVSLLSIVLSQDVWVRNMHGYLLVSRWLSITWTTMATGLNVRPALGCFEPTDSATNTWTPWTTGLNVLNARLAISCSSLRLLQTSIWQASTTGDLKSAANHATGCFITRDRQLSTWMHWVTGHPRYRVRPVVWNSIQLPVPRIICKHRDITRATAQIVACDSRMTTTSKWWVSHFLEQHWFLMNFINSTWTRKSTVARKFFVLSVRTSSPLAAAWPITWSGVLVLRHGESTVRLSSKWSVNMTRVVSSPTNRLDGIKTTTPNTLLQTRRSMATIGSATYATRNSRSNLI